MSGYCSQPDQSRPLLHTLHVYYVCGIKHYKWHRGANHSSPVFLTAGIGSGTCIIAVYWAQARVLSLAIWRKWFISCFCLYNSKRLRMKSLLGHSLIYHIENSVFLYPYSVMLLHTIVWWTWPYNFVTQWKVKLIYTIVVTCIRDYVAVSWE